MTTKPFHLGDILSAMTGKLVSPRGLDGMYETLAYLAGGPVWTHQIPRVCREAGPAILAQHPALAAVNASGVTPENWRAWLAEQVSVYGEWLDIATMTADQYARIDPVSELAEMVGPGRIVVAGGRDVETTQKED